MPGLNKKEAIGVVASLVTVALAFAFMRLVSSNTAPLAVFEDAREEAIVNLPLNGDIAAAADTLSGARGAAGELRDLVVQDVIIGEGREAAVGDILTVHYIGVLESGAEFDNSYTAGEPFVFTLGRGDVIEGWDRGLLGMKAGGRRIIAVPSSMAYGNLSLGNIPANSTLIFAVELLEIR